MRLQIQIIIFTAYSSKSQQFAPQLFLSTINTQTMNNIFTNIRAYFARLSHQSQQDTALRVQQAATKEAERALQIREFQGELYLSFNNRPILPFNGRDNEEQKEAQNIAVEVLSIARKTYREYIIAQEKKTSL